MFWRQNDICNLSVFYSKRGVVALNAIVLLGRRWVGRWRCDGASGGGGVVTGKLGKKGGMKGEVKGGVCLTYLTRVKR